MALQSRLLVPEPPATDAFWKPCCEKECHNSEDEPSFMGHNGNVTTAALAMDPGHPHFSLLSAGYTSSLWLSNVSGAGGEALLHPMPTFVVTESAQDQGINVFSSHSSSKRHSSHYRALRLYQLSGALLGKSFLDPDAGYPDLPLSPPFLTLLQGRKLGVLSKRRDALVALKPLPFQRLFELQDSLRAGGARDVEEAAMATELEMYFLQMNLGVFGAPHVPLAPFCEGGGGAAGAQATASINVGCALSSPPVTLKNLGTYLSSVGEAVFGRGVAGAVAAFREGLGIFTPSPSLFMGLLTVKEWGEYLGQDSDEIWSREALLLGLEPSGYAKGELVEWLADTLAAFSRPDRRSFTVWACASQKLPEGGLVQNPIKVQTQSGPWDKVPLNDKTTRASLAALCYPTVSTCQNTLRLPPYGDRSTLERLLRVAMVASGGFHLT